MTSDLREEPRVRRVALTGGIATGKSYVRARFEALDVPTIDADTLARDAVAVGTAGLDAVVRRFGEAIRDETGGLNRRKLASIVFADAEARQALEAIIHPFVRAMTDEWFASLDPARHPFAVADIPLLFEGGRDVDFEKVVVTACGPDIQLLRLMARDSLSREEALRRIAAQWPIDQKVAKADFVIRTDGSPADTDRHAAEVVDQLKRWSAQSTAG